MAEAIVSVATERVSNFLIGEAIFLSGVREEVKRLLAELKRMRSFLIDASKKQNQDERVRNWVAEIRDIAYDSENIIDYFLLKVARRDVPICSIERITSLFKKSYHLYVAGNQIKSLRTKLGDIEKSMQIYGIKFDDKGEGPSSMDEMRTRARRSYPHEEEEDLITLEECTNDLMAQLMREEKHKRVVSIVGMGGLGKTTLAKKVYNKAEVKRHFDCYSWAFISQQFSVNSVLLGILKDVAPQVKIKEREDPTLKLFEVLKEKRYLMVLDDIWQIEAWNSLKQAFPNGRSGSKILFTTRIVEVALHADPTSSPIKLPILSEEDSWNLFRNKTFLRYNFGENYCAPEFERLGREMVKKCGGLPLAIVVLGGLLATKKSTMEWEAIDRSMTAQFKKLDEKQLYGGVHEILALSYHQLPWHLKPCFLYFSMFPEDSEINRKSLVRMWIAEGFVSTAQNQILEDVGDECFEEFVSRSMIQVSLQWGTGHRRYRMHDLMRDMCVTKEKEENFLEVVGDHVVDAAAISSISPRISIHGANESLEHHLSMIKDDAHLRALFYVPQLPKVLLGPNLRLISKNFGLLRVIHIADGVTKVPREIGRLIHLRYLRCKRSGSLPASIGNLRNLHTLDVRGSYWQLRLPDVLWKLECLRHLLADIDDAGSWRVDTLRNLETLRWISAESLLKNDAMLKLTNLRDLRMLFRESAEVEEILRSPFFQRQGHLRSLVMRPEVRISPFPTIQSIPQCGHLYKIDLAGTILGDSSQLEFLPVSLIKITLRWSGLKQDPMPILEKLPNLMHLRLLEEAYEGSQMVFSARGFPALQSLELELTDIQELRVEKGALPHLHKLVIRGVLYHSMEEFRNKAPFPSTSSYVLWLRS